MTAALEHPMVALYLRVLDKELASLEPEVAAELSGQLRAQIVDALPARASDEVVSEVLAALGAPAAVVAEAAPPRPPGNRWQSLRHRVAVRASRVPRLAWLVIVLLVAGLCAGAATLIFWEAQPSLEFNSGSYVWWYPADSAHSVTTEAGDVTQDTIPLRPGHLQGFAILIYNPSGVTQHLLGAAPDTVSLGAPVPPQIAVATTTPSKLQGEPHAVRYRIGGAVPPHSYRWVRVLWRSYRCSINDVGAAQESDRLTVRVRLGWVTRTEVVQLPATLAVTATKASVDKAFCRSRGDVATP